MVCCFPLNGFFILFLHWISQETLPTVTPVFQKVDLSGLETLQTSSLAIQVRPKFSRTDLDTPTLSGLNAAETCVVLKKPMSQ